MEFKKRLEEYGIHHVGFIVKDLDETINHFNNFYGINNFKVYEFSPNSVWSYGRKVVSEYKLKIAMGYLDSKNCAIEIIQPLIGDGVHRDFIESGHNGLHHICFSVDEFDFWKEYFNNKGAEFIFESETEDEINGYRRCFYAKDKETDMIFEIKENPYFK